MSGHWRRRMARKRPPTDLPDVAEDGRQAIHCLGQRQDERGERDGDGRQASPTRPFTRPATSRTAKTAGMSGRHHMFLSPIGRDRGTAMSTSRHHATTTIGDQRQPRRPRQPRPVAAAAPRWRFAASAFCRSCSAIICRLSIQARQAAQALGQVGGGAARRWRAAEMLGIHSSISGRASSPDVDVGVEPRAHALGHQHGLLQQQELRAAPPSRTAR